MIVKCPSCGARFRFDDAKIKSGGVKVRCSKCKSTFIVKKSGVVPLASNDEDRTTRPAVNGEIDQVIKQTIKKDKRQTAKIPREQLDDFVQSSISRPTPTASRAAEEDFDGIVRDPFSKKLIEEIGSAVVPPPDVPSQMTTGAHMPPPDASVQKIINDPTYSHEKTPTLNPANEDIGEVSIDDLQRKIDYVTSITAHRYKVPKQPEKKDTNMDIEPPLVGGPGKAKTITSTVRKKRSLIKQDPADEWDLSKEMGPPDVLARDMTTGSRRRAGIKKENLFDVPAADFPMREMSTGRRRMTGAGAAPPSLGPKDFTTGSRSMRQNSADWAPTDMPAQPTNPRQTGMMNMPSGPAVDPRGNTTTGYYRGVQPPPSDSKSSSGSSALLKLIVVLLLLYGIAVGVASAMKGSLAVAPGDIVAVFQGKKKPVEHEQIEPVEPDPGSYDPFELK